MPAAIFGISNSGLNLVVSLFVLMLVVVWLALIVYTYLDARRRVSDPFLVACATVASFIPYLGTIVYVIVRPPEFLEDAHERELEIKAAELRVRQLTEVTCPKCEQPIEKSFLRCPHCERRLKDPCANCGKPVDPRWSLCPYCESDLPRQARRSRPAPERGSREAPAEGASREERPERRRRETSSSREEAPVPEKLPASKRPRKQAPAATGGKESATRSASQEAPKPKRTQRSQSREPDPDPRQA